MKTVKPCRPGCDRDASLPDVVQAVNAAEMTISMVVAVRDRMIGAYQELMRTQI